MHRRGDAAALVDAIRSIRSVASACRDRAVMRLLDEVLRQAQIRPSPRTLMAFVEERLRREVPLLAVIFSKRPRVAPRKDECLAFELGHADAADAQRMHVEFRPAGSPDASQVRLLHAAASVMSLIYGWSRAPVREAS